MSFEVSLTLKLFISRLTILFTSTVLRFGIVMELEFNCNAKFIDTINNCLE